jgi:peptidoglycan/xylan/chitin deacetylase (PgdA/CDA1 family)
MYSCRLLFACFATLIFAPALRAEHTPAAKRAVPATTPVKSTAATATPVKRALPARSVRATSEEPGITFNSVQVDGPYIAMTFDDGPSATLTPKLLDLLAARHIKATFFVVGQNAADHPEIVARAAREGHEIANHSWSHPNLGKMSDENVRRQLQQTDDAIKNASGKRPTLMRPPYGSITTREKHWIHDEFGYDIILWDVDPLDWKRPGPAVVRSRILKETRPGSIILSHDIHPGTIEAMPSTFDELQAKGFKFVTVSELIRMAASRTPHPSAEPSASVSPGGSTGFAFPTPSPSPTISPGE